MSSPEEDEERRLKRLGIDAAQIIAYVGIAVVGTVGFFVTGQQQEDLCETSLDNREALRNVVSAIDRLGTDLVLEDKPASAATREEKDALRTLNEFRRQQSRLLDYPPCERP